MCLVFTAGIWENENQSILTGYSKGNLDISQFAETTGTHPMNVRSTHVQSLLLEACTTNGSVQCLLEVSKD